jgi:hypothetical protein
MDPNATAPWLVVPGLRASISDVGATPKRARERNTDEAIFALAFWVILTIAPAVAQPPSHRHTTSRHDPSGDTGLFFVPTGEVLPTEVVGSFYRTNTRWPGLPLSRISRHVRLRHSGSFRAVRRVHPRDAHRPRTPCSSPAPARGQDAPAAGCSDSLHRTGWRATVGDFWLGGSSTSPPNQTSAPGVCRSADDPPAPEEGVSSGRVDFPWMPWRQGDRRWSSSLRRHDGGAVGPLTNGLRWRPGGLSAHQSHGLLVTTELFGETISTRPSRARRTIRRDLRGAHPTNIRASDAGAGLTWQARRASSSALPPRNLNMSNRSEARCACPRSKRQGQRGAEHPDWIPPGVRRPWRRRPTAAGGATRHPRRLRPDQGRTTHL